MKQYQRRELGIAETYNLDVWNADFQCWSKSKRVYVSEDAARRAAKRQGRYRISKSSDGGRIEMEPFTVE